MKRLLIVAALFLSYHVSNAQVTKADIALEYNSQTCLFDVYLVVAEGQTTNIIHRVQGGSQLTMVAPSGSTLYVEETFMPIEDNRQYDGEVPANWEVADIVDGPEASSQYSFHSISPKVSPTAFYNDLNVGDKVKLFSVSVTPMVNCLSDVRMYENGTDPSEDAAGMQGSDFSNSLSLGSVKPSYNANKQIVGPQKPVIESFDYVGNRLVSTHEVYNQACSANVSYAWMYKGQVIKSTEVAPTLSKEEIASGDYSFRITDGLGCTTNRVVALDLGVQATTEEKTAIEKEQTVLSSALDGKNEIKSNLYPNPAKDITYIELQGVDMSTMSVHISDMDGKMIDGNVMKNAEITEERLKINLAEYPTGVYNLSVFNRGELVKNHKLIVIE